MPAHYNDPQFSYLKYWSGRNYEQASELIALKRFLKKRSFTTSADIGGGYGRLTPVLCRCSQITYLIEPSSKQLKIATTHLSSLSNLKFLSGTSSSIPLPDHSLDLGILIRVSHHLPDLDPTFTELVRVLKPSALLILEIANSANFKARLTSWFSGTPISLLPVERRRLSNIRKKTIPFVNHHPQTVIKSLVKHNFIILDRLSVSNFRVPLFKKILPTKLIVFLEYIIQKPLGKLLFGPSIFLLCQQKPTPLDSRSNP